MSKDAQTLGIAVLTVRELIGENVALRKLLSRHYTRKQLRKELAEVREKRSIKRRSLAAFAQWRDAALLPNQDQVWKEFLEQMPLSGKVQ